MATHNCNHQNQNCGCNDSYTVTAPCPPACPEVFNAQCIVYTGTDIVCNSDTVISRYDYLDTIITKLVNYLCSVQAPVTEVVGSEYINVVPNVVDNVTTYTVSINIPALQAYFDTVFQLDILASILAGPGIDVAPNPLTGTVTISHQDTSAVGDVSSDNSGNSFIQDVFFTFDTYGHVTGATVIPGTVVPPNDFLTAQINPDSGFVWGPDNDPTNLQIADAPADTLNFVAGVGITLNASTDPSTDAIRITNTAPNVDQNIWFDIFADTGSTSPDTTTDSLSIYGGTGISTSIVGDLLTIVNNANVYETIAGDAGAPTTASGLTDTLNIVGETNASGEGVQTTVTADTVTIATTFNKHLQSSSVLIGATISVPHNLNTAALLVSVLEFDGGLPSANAYVHGTDYTYNIINSNTIEITNISGVNWNPGLITVMG